MAILLVLIAATLAINGAVAASASSRALPPSPLFPGQGLQDVRDKDLDEGGQGQGLQAVHELALDGLHALQSLHDEDTIDILVPPYLFGFSDVGEQEVQMKLSPMQRLSLPSFSSILPHFNSSCSCEHWKCSCCARVEIPPIRRNKTGCASLTYVSDRLAVQLQLSINNRTLLERDLISGSNPPPFCFPPIPSVPIVTVCLRFSNISLLTEDAKVQACASVEVGLVFTSPLIRFRFGCLKIGRGGISWSGTPTAHSQNLTALDTQSAFEQFAATFNTTDTEQFQLLQSILRQQEVYEPSEKSLPSRNEKMAWSTVLPRNPRTSNQ